MQSQLAAMDTNETTQHQVAASGGRGVPKAAAFVLACLAQLPEAFQVALGQPLLLQPFTEVSGCSEVAPLIVLMLLTPAAWSLACCQAQLASQSPARSACATLLSCVVVLTRCQR